MKLQAIFGIAAVSTLALFGQAQSAQAFNLNLTAGAASPTGVTNQGAYSEFAGLSTTKTVDFNSGSAPTTGFAKYSFQSAGQLVKSMTVNILQSSQATTSRSISPAK
jgi:hypothetical protein